MHVAFMLILDEGITPRLPGDLVVHDHNLPEIGSEVVSFRKCGLLENC